MNDTTPDLVRFSIQFRSREIPATYQATPDVLAAIAADWQRQCPRTPLAAAIERDPGPQVYQVFDLGGVQRPLMFRLDDVLYIG